MSTNTTVTAHPPHAELRPLTPAERLVRRLCAAYLLRLARRQLREEWLRGRALDAAAERHRAEALRRHEAAVWGQCRTTRVL